jgi:hypothetical protein
MQPEFVENFPNKSGCNLTMLEKLLNYLRFVSGMIQELKNRSKTLRKDSLNLSKFFLPTYPAPSLYTHIPSPTHPFFRLISMTLSVARCT